MLKFVPDFILHAYEQKEYTGSLKGFVLFFDISGFTRFTESWSAMGIKGAQEIYRTLYQIFDPVLTIIEECGGTITSFAGDSLIAIYPETAGNDVFCSVLRIKEIMTGLITSDDINISESLGGRITVSFGEISWEIISHPIQNEYYFKGKAILECSELERYKKLLIFTKAAAEMAGIEKFKNLDYGYIPLSDHITANENSPIKEYRFDLKTIEAFIPAEFRSINVENEFRDVACAFISLDAVLSEERSEAIRTILSLTSQYGGYFNKLDYSDKGLVAIILFGVPRHIEKILDRILDFAFEVTDKVKSAKAGLTRGRSYAGFTGSEKRREYTILGFTPNLASRLMETAKPGKILVDKFTQEQIAGKYYFAFQGNLQIKGFSKDIPVYECQSKIERNSFFSPSEFVGRKQELKEIFNIYHRVVNTQAKIICLIHGEPGIGKSRLIDKVRKELSQEKLIWCLFMCDGILKQAYAPIRKFLFSYLKLENLSNDQSIKEHFINEWQDIAGENEEIMKLESFIGHLAGINWDDSLFSQIPEYARPEQLKQALIKFFIFLAKQQTLVINIDDAQWIDPYTEDFLQELIKRLKDSRLFVISSCRYKEDGSMIDFNPEGLERIDIRLNRLRMSSTQEMMKNILKLGYIPQETEQFIIRKSQSNPLFIEQITWYLQEQNIIDADGFLRANIEYVNTFGITDIIGARIDRLSEDMRKVVFYASVLGMEFNVNVLREMMGGNLNQALITGENNKVWAKLSDFEYMFTHILLRDTAYSRMLNKKRMELHLLAAVSYEKTTHDTEDEKTLEIIGFHYEKANKMIKAAEYYIKAGKIARKFFRLNDANRFYDKAYLIHQEYEPDNALQLAEDMHLISVIKCIRSYHKEGIRGLLQVLDVYQSHLGNWNEKTISVIHDLSSAYRESRDFTNAMVYLNKELEFSVVLNGEIHPSISSIYNQIGLVYYLKSDYQRARECFNKAEEILNSCEGEHPHFWVVTYGNLALVSHIENMLQQALDYHLKIIEINSRLLPPEHYEIGRNNLNLGGLYIALNQLEDAEKCFLKAARIQLSVTGKYHPRMANIYSYLCEIEIIRHKLDKAMDYARDSLDIVETMLGAEHPEAATCFLNIGKIELEQGEFEEARKDFLRCVEIREKVLGDNDPFTAEAWLYMGKFLLKVHKYPEAESYLNRCVYVFRKLYGEKHPLVDNVCRSLAQLYIETGEYKKAKELLSETLIRLEMHHHLTEEDIAQTNYMLGKCCYELNDKLRAVMYLDLAWQYYRGSEAKPEFYRDLKHILNKVGKRI